MKFSSLGNQKGFTLVELLVVIAILGILVGIVVPSLISFNRRQQLRNAAGEVITALRVAQNKALAAEIEFRPATDCPADPAAPSGQPIPVTHLQGWYARFESNANSYKISGRCATSWGSNYEPVAWADFNDKEFQLPQGVRFGTLSQSPIYILFSPVSKSVTFYKDIDPLTEVNPPINEFEIPIVMNGGDPVTVTVTSGGKIR